MLAFIDDDNDDAMTNFRCICNIYNTDYMLYSLKKQVCIYIFVIIFIYLLRFLRNEPPNRYDVNRTTKSGILVLEEWYQKREWIALYTQYFAIWLRGLPGFSELGSDLFVFYMWTMMFTAVWCFCSRFVAVVCCFWIFDHTPHIRILYYPMLWPVSSMTWRPCGCFVSGLLITHAFQP